MEKTKLKVLGAAVHPVTQKEALEYLRLFLSASTARHVVTLNSEMIVRAQEDEEFREIVAKADLSTADGMGVLAAASYLKKKKGEFLPDLVNLLLMPFYEIFFPEKIADVLPEKISGIDLIHSLCASDFMAGKRIYLVGAGKGIAEKAARVLRERYPHIVIAGAEEGMGGGTLEADEAALLKRIDAAAPDVLLVALGSPRQERWISGNLPCLGKVKIAIGVGGSFDFISGERRRAPRILQEHGMEWLWRLALQPSRLWRIYNATFRLAWLAFRHKEKPRSLGTP